MLFKGFEFIALNYNQHRLKQQKGFCSVPPLLCPLFLILFHSLHFSSLHAPLLPSVTSSYVKVSGFFVTNVLSFTLRRILTCCQLNLFLKFKTFSVGAYLLRSFGSGCIHEWQLKEFNLMSIPLNLG